MNANSGVLEYRSGLIDEENTCMNMMMCIKLRINKYFLVFLTDNYVNDNDNDDENLCVAKQTCTFVHVSITIQLYLLLKWITVPERKRRVRIPRR